MTDKKDNALTRRLRRVVALALMALALWLGALTAPRWSKALVRGGLEQTFGREATVGAVAFHALPPAIEIFGVKVLGPSRTAAPFLEVPRIEVTPTLSPLWAGEIVLSRLVIERPTVRVNAYPEGGDDIPRFSRSSSSIISTTVRHLVVESGELFLNHERVPLDLDLPDVRGHLSASRSGTLTGNLAFGPGAARFGTSPVLPIGAEMDLVLDGAQVTVPAGHITAKGTDVAYSGRLRLGSPVKGEFTLVGDVDLEVLDQHVLGTGFDIGGKGRYDGRLSVEGASFRLEGSMEGKDGVFRRVAVPRFSGRVLWQGGTVRISDLALDALGGSARLDIDVGHARTRARVRGRIEGMDTEGLLRPLFSTSAASIDASATANLDLDWPRGRIRLLSGTITADLLPRGDERTPLSGRFEWRSENGVQTIEKTDLKTPSTWMQASGRVEVDDAADLALDVQSADLAATDDLLARIRRALGEQDASTAGFAGSGVFRGRWRGALEAPVFEGRFAGKSVGYLGVSWGGAEWSGSATRDAVVSHSLVLHSPSGELWLDGRIETGLLGGKDGIDARLRFTNWPAADFVTGLSLKTKLEGPVSGEAEIRGRRSEPFGTVRLRAPAGRLYGDSFANLDLALALKGHVTEVEKGRATLGGGDVEFRGAVDDDGNYDAHLDARDVDVAEFLPHPAGDALWGGRASLSLSLKGPLDKPTLRARLTSPHLFLGDEGVGAIEATARGEGDGGVDVDLRCHSPRVDVSLTGQVAAEAPFVADLKASLRETSLDPFLRKVYPSVPAALAMVATGEAKVTGPLASPKDLLAVLQIPGFEVGLPDFQARSREPISARLEAGRLEIKDFHLTGEDTELALRGSATLVGDGPLDLTARGRADLGIIGIVSRRLSGRGDASLSVQVSGTLPAPRVEGRLDVQRAGLRVRGFPHGIDDFKGTLHFTQSGADLEEATGSVAGGPVSLSGQASYGNGRKASFDLKASGHGMALRYPEGLRSVVDADLRFFGDESLQWLTGDIEVKQALWTRRYDLASELLTSSAPPLETSTLPGRVRLDMKVRVPGTLTIDNNLATLTARAELNLSGTDEAPAILGRAEVDHGRVYFQGNTYVIRRGTIDFTNPQKIDPSFNIEADSRVGSYRVTLKVNGTLERVYPTLTSDPPLTALQILNLLAGADESTVTSLQTQTDQARLAATGAASLAASKISEEVGLERGAEKLLGLNRFSIDPSLIRGTSVNPTARLTLGKRITPDLSVLYSLDLLGTQDRVLSVEYTLSDRLSVVLTSSDQTGLGFDVSLRHAR